MSTPDHFALERFDVAEIGSITAIFTAKAYAAGLYVLHFGDGQAYTGQAADVAAQFLADRAEWDDIDAVEFVSWPADELVAGATRLSAITAQTAQLRTRGQDVPAAAASSRDVFPLERGKRITVTSGEVGDRRSKFWELSDHLAYQEIRSIVADYINSTIPDPVNTQKYLWNVVALPATDGAEDRRRLLTLYCGDLETLYITEITHDDDTIELDLAINTAIPAQRSDAELEVSNDSVIAGVGGYENERVWSWSIDLGALLEEDVDVELSIDDDTFDDLAYALNVRLLSRDGSSHARHHNQDLANDLLAEAYRQS
ncbi:hypothetical protein [Rhodococcoides yunnanense]|uniref:hypothetical protein n=1 Tax=Rhodococcoides yunnanense TaxID=278209 RepID=UPI000A72E3D6|nr:hypothetical protein [Rhodococcus yunnanensis]